MRRSKSPEMAKLLPDTYDFHAEADMVGLVGRLFSSTLGAVIPTVDQVEEVAEAELSELRYELFVAKHKLDLPGTQDMSTRTVVELARLRGASVEATSVALDTAERIMLRHLSRLVYPKPSDAVWEHTRVILNQTIEWVKQEAAAFEASLSEQPSEGIQQALWSGQSFASQPPRVEVSNYLYEYKLRLEVVVYAIGLDSELALEFFGAKDTLVNPTDGDLTRWLIQQQAK